MRSPWLQALTDRMNLIMLGLAIVSGLLAAWWLLPIGLLIWLVMLAVTANDAASRQ